MDLLVDIVDVWLSLITICCHKLAHAFSKSFLVYCDLMAQPPIIKNRETASDLVALFRTSRVKLYACFFI